MDFIKLDKTLKKEVKLQKARKILDDQLRNIPNVQTFRLSNQITLLVCNIIEYLFRNNKTKYRIDKKQFVIEILNSVFSFNDQETQIINTQIEYLHENNLITQIPFYKIAGMYLLNMLKKKVD